MTPNPLALLVAALRAQPSVATPVANRIGTDWRGIFPAVRITLVGGPDSPTESTDSPILQWEVSADDELAALDLARALQDVAPRLAGSYTPGTVAASWPVGYFFGSPDPATNRKRFIGQIGLLTQP